MSKDAVVLLSGGLDSATTLAIALSEGLRCHAVTFRYGQRHHAEVAAAGRVAKSLGVEDHRIIPVAIGELAGSSLTDPSLRVPKDRSAEQLREGIPSTYVPARNTIFLACALAVAELTRSDFIYIGVNSMDYSGYPDCRPEYVEAFRRVARLATRRAVEGCPPEIVAPLQSMSKAEIITKGAQLGVDYSLTLSCYDPDELARACGGCDACQLRRRGFEEAGVTDPTIYQPGVQPRKTGVRC
jgi:7-cyano-7-deazaguanine synthase